MRIMALSSLEAISLIGLPSTIDAKITTSSPIPEMLQPGTHESFAEDLQAHKSRSLYK